MAAIELALAYSAVPAGSDVLVFDNACFTVAAAVIRHGARVTFVPTRGRPLPDVQTVMRAMDRHPSAVIVVHQYGIPFPVERLRARLAGSMSIIEDCSQAFGAHYGGERVGTHADLAVTSLDAGKPLSLAGGGALFGRDPAIAELMVRRRDDLGFAGLPKSCRLPAAMLERAGDAVARAQRRLEERRSTVARLRRRFTALGADIWALQPGDEATWHRVPIVPRSAAVQRTLVQAARDGLLQVPHRIRTGDLALFGGSDRPHAPRHFLAYPDRLETLFDVLSGAGH